MTTRLWFSALLTIQLLTSGCGEETVTTPVNEKSERIIPVSMVMAQQRDTEHLLLAIGTLESYQKPTLSAETAGNLMSISVDEGDRVEKGQVLAEIESTLYQIKTDAAAAELRRLSVIVKNQQKEVERLSTLAKKQSVSKDRLEDEQAQLRVLIAQQDIAAKMLQEAKHWQDKASIVSPITGRVAKRHISTGDYVRVGDKLFDLVAVDKLRARLNYPEHEAPAISLGKVVRLSSPSSPNQSVHGVVKSIRPVVNPASRAIEVLVEVENSGGWLPGSTVDAELVVGTAKDVLTIPVAAVMKRNHGDVVYLVTASRAQEKVVQLGRRTDDWVEVLEGLHIGDAVVLDGANYITAGSAVLVSK